MNLNRKIALARKGAVNNTPKNIRDSSARILGIFLGRREEYAFRAGSHDKDKPRHLASTVSQQR